MKTFTKTEFYQQVLEFRKLFGSPEFWAKPSSQRQLALNGFGHVWLNCPDREIDDTYWATMNEYTRRESMLVMAGKASMA